MSYVQLDPKTLSVEAAKYRFWTVLAFLCERPLLFIAAGQERTRARFY